MCMVVFFFFFFFFNNKKNVYLSCIALNDDLVGFCAVWMSRIFWEEERKESFWVLGGKEIVKYFWVFSSFGILEMSRIWLELQWSLIV